VVNEEEYKINVLDRLEERAEQEAEAERQKQENEIQKKGPTLKRRPNS